MLRNEFNSIMSLMNDIWGGYNPSTFDTWFQLLEKFQAATVRDAVWMMAETVKMKPRIADIVDAMGKSGTVGGGSQAIEPTTCFCGGSGWVTVEKEPREFVMMRCICERGDRLSEKYSRLTDGMIKARRINIKGEVRLRNPEEEARETKILGMDTDKLIAGCKRRLGQMGGRL